MHLTKDFTATAKFFHWLMAAIIIVGWFVGLYAVQILKPGLAQDEIITLHKDIATPVLLLIVLRSLWRVTHRPRCRRWCRRISPQSRSTMRFTAMSGISRGS